MTGPRALALAIALATFAACSNDAQRGETPAGPWVEIRGAQVAVELARTKAEQVQGLSDRTELAWGRGMLFQYPTASFQRFWMRRMHFAIDIVWIRDDRIVRIHHRVPPPPDGTPDSKLPTYGSGELVDAVLEVPAGYAEANGWRRGDTVTLGPEAAY